MRVFWRAKIRGDNIAKELIDEAGMAAAARRYIDGGTAHGGRRPHYAEHS